MWRHGAPRSLTYNTAVMPKLSVAAVLSAAVAFGPQATLPRERVSHELPQHETAHLTIATSSDPAAVAPGQKVTLTVAVTPKPKIHVYAPGQEGYIPISLTLEPAPAVAAAKAKYPAGEKFLMPALNETQIVYAKPFRITQEVTLTSAAAGSVTIKGTVRYQACDEAICYLPKTVPVEWTIAVK
jgi:DsbC/DsbD-like thiol-disulfide interchange protein